MLDAPYSLEPQLTLGDTRSAESDHADVIWRALRERPLWERLRLPAPYKLSCGLPATLGTAARRGLLRPARGLRSG